MQMYLVRHAEAVEGTESLPDEMRYLSKSGRKQIRKQGKNLKNHKVRPGLILTSPLARAVQSAELLAAELGVMQIVVHPSLLPDAEPEAVVEMLTEIGPVKALMLVGHDPHLSSVAAQLSGYEYVDKISKGSCLALFWKPGQHAVFTWLASCNGKMVKKKSKPETGKRKA